MPKEAARLAELVQQSEGVSPGLLEAMIGLRNYLLSRRHHELAWRVALAFGILVSLLLWNNQRLESDRIVQARIAGRAATCQGFQAFTSSLISVAQNPDPVRVQQFIDGLNEQLKPLNCTIVIPQH